MDAKLGFLAEAWKQACSDLSAAQGRFRGLTHVFVATSFGVSAFLLADGDIGERAWMLAGTADTPLVVAFALLMRLSVRELDFGRATVEAYERAISEVFKHPERVAEVPAFPDIAKNPDFPLRNERRTAIVAVALVAVKTLVLVLLGLT